MVYMVDQKSTASEGRKRREEEKKKLPNAVSLLYKFDFSSSGT